MLNLQVSVGLVILHDWELADESLGSVIEENDFEAGEIYVSSEKLEKSREFLGAG